VLNMAMLTGTAYEGEHQNASFDAFAIFGAHLRAVRHDVLRAVSKPVPAPTRNHVLRMSKGNVAIQPMIPAAAPARSGAQGRCERVSPTTSSGTEPG
jgi:hypothetical protein